MSFKYKINKAYEDGHDDRKKSRIWMSWLQIGKDIKMNSIVGAA